MVEQRWGRLEKNCFEITKSTEALDYTALDTFVRGRRCQQIESIPCALKKVFRLRGEYHVRGTNLSLCHGNVKYEKEPSALKKAVRSVIIPRKRGIILYYCTAF